MARPVIPPSILTRRKRRRACCSTFIIIKPPQDWWPITLGNPNLKWESTTGTNLGIDFAVLNNRVSGTVEGYQTKTSNLLLARQLPSISGYASVLQNIGKLQNQGLDVTLNTVNIKTRNFTWQTTIVFSTYKNKLVQLYGDNKDDIGNSWFLGKSLGALYTYQLQGVWQTGETRPA